ncbi:Transcription factor lepE [Fusarium oxysporum f. sp. albedinis]|nr:Transcription factor lepE [Fusarium oxysporum f. sp. albedinis]
MAIITTIIRHFRAAAVMYCASSQVPLVKGPCKFQLLLRRASAVRIDAAEARRRHQRVRIAIQTQLRHKLMNYDKDCTMQGSYWTRILKITRRYRDRGTW